MATRTPVAVIGASGYVGAELVRLLVNHPHVALRGLYAHRRAGDEVAKDFPQFAGIVQAKYEPYDAAAVAASGCEAAFLALPHGESARAAKELYERGLTVLDLSADLRLRSAELYAEWYKPHVAPELLSHAVYGLVERHREAVRQARLVAVPGCYPTASILALAPLIDARLVRADGLIVDAKSGVSGAGREPQRATHVSEIGEGVRAYKVAGTHRHTPEIEQELARAAQLLAVQLGEAVDRAGQELGRRVARVLGGAVPGGVFGLIGEAEVGAEVEDRHAAIDERGRGRGALAVRQRQERDLGALRDPVGIEGLERERQPPGKLREHPRQRLARLRARVHAGQLDPRMAEAQAKQLGAGVPRRAHHGDGDSIAHARSIASRPRASASGATIRLTTRHDSRGRSKK